MEKYIKLDKLGEGTYGAVFKGACCCVPTAFHDCKHADWMCGLCCPPHRVVCWGRGVVLAFHRHFLL
jgi:hypothetical protein